PDGRRFLTHVPGSAAIWWVAGGPAIARLASEARPELGPDGRSVLTAATSRVQVWDVDRKALIFEAPPVPGPSAPTAISSDGRKILSMAGDTVWLWDWAKGDRNGLALRFLRKEFTAARFSPDGRWILAEDAERVVIWDAENGTMVGYTVAPLA